jgi:acetylornithine deacetylase/succinyl-diaminopimelate desuccinylase-like protein
MTRRVDRDEIVALASRLISTPSTSGDERAIMDDVVRWCEETGLRYDVSALDPARPNVIVSVGDPAAGPAVVMNGHLGTVLVIRRAARPSRR